MAINGALKFLVLKNLLDGNKRCSEIANLIESQTGWKVSPGSIYPLMKDLTKRNLIELKIKEKSKLYSITLKGKIFLKMSDKKKREIRQKIEEGIKFLKILGEKDYANAIKKHFKKEKAMTFCKELSQLDKLFSEIDLEKNEEKIKKIFQDSINKLEKLK